MKYVMLIQPGPAAERYAEMDTAEQQAYLREWAALNRNPGVTPGVRMVEAELATTVRVGDDGATLVTDGPFVELKEALGGIFIYEAEDLDAAIAFAATVPITKHGGAVEIRPALIQDV